MKSMSTYCMEQFGEKLYKLCLNGGMTCPNRDGRVGFGGCIFCSAGGSGDFAGNASDDIENQIRAQKLLVSKKYHGSRYIAYLQPFTNSYAAADQLDLLYRKIILRKDIACLSIATRPDCLEADKLNVLEDISKIKPVWVELGLQTANDDHADMLNRCYKTKIYDEAVDRLNSIGIHVITHVILGLPGETLDDMLDTCKRVAEAGSGGIKLQMLQVLSGTKLAEIYRASPFPLMELDEYCNTVAACLKVLPGNMVLHRMTGDPAKKTLIAPEWVLDKKHVLNELHKSICEAGIELT